MPLKFATTLLFALLFAAPVTAQDGEILKRTKIAGWNVSKLQTPKDGLSCQAYKCNTAECNVDTAEATVRLWGSERRKAVTPMIGTNRTASGASDATISIGGTAFPLSQAKGSRGKLFIADDAADDARIIRLAAANPRGTVTFTSRQASAVFRLNGVSRVLAFFEKECGIPKP